MLTLTSRIDSQPSWPFPEKPLRPVDDKPSYPPILPYPYTFSAGYLGRQVELLLPFSRLTDVEMTKMTTTDGYVKPADQIIIFASGDLTQEWWSADAHLSSK